MTPLFLYQNDLKKPDFFADQSQADAVEHLQRLYTDLQGLTESRVKNDFLSRLITNFFNKPLKKQPIKGVYFYGGVGRGKTYLVDLFFHSLQTERKLRLHFHHFMLRVHKELAALEGQVNPLKKIAEKFSSETDVLCFDEFFVDDIADAMLLAGMFDALFELGVVLVATSNLHPADLYKNGLQRARFLPAIELVCTHCEVYNLDGGKDYRIGRLIEAEIYHSPLDERATLQIEQTFESLADGDRVYAQPIQINGRNIATIAYCVDTLSIEFESLCVGPRSVLDYIELAILYRAVLVANIKQMNDQHDDIARRFIAMVDEFYDRHVVLIISAEVEVMQLYTGTKLNFEFQRCISRLLEMQSTRYLQLAHHIEE